MNQRGDRPDWVMCGVSAPDGKVAIFASTELSQAELETRRDDFYDFAGFGALRAPVRATTLTVEMRGYVVVVADTYEQAFRSLFDQWSPRREEPARLPGSRPEITADAEAGG